MAFFPSSNGPLNNAGAPVEATHDEVRRKARFRLIGSAILLLIAVIVFTWLFDSQPRPIPVDIDIDIPEQSELEALPDSTPVAIPTPIRADPSPQANDAADATDALASEKAAQDKAELAKAEKAKLEKAKADKVKAEKARADKAKAAQAEKNEQQAAATDDASDKPSTERSIIHIGSFQDPEQVKQVRARATKAGVPTLIQHVQTRKGPFTRVRVGPFDDDAAAKDALKKLRAAGLRDSVIKPLGQ